MIDSQPKQTSGAAGVTVLLRAGREVVTSIRKALFEKSAPSPLRSVTNLIVVAGIAGAAILNYSTIGGALAAEQGVVENLSAIVLACGVLLAGIHLWRTPSRIGASICLAMLWMYMRELDYQREFTPRSIESLRFYTSDIATTQMKLVAATALLPCVAAGLHLLFHGIRAIRWQPSVPPMWLRPILCAVIFAVGALTAEKLLPPAAQVVEEVFELAFAALIVLTVAIVGGEASRRAVPQLSPPLTSTQDLKPNPGTSKPTRQNRLSALS